MAGSSARPSRRAKLLNVDYAVLTSGQQIPEFSSDDDRSDDDFVVTGHSKNKRRSSWTPAVATGPRKRASKADKRQCFICKRNPDTRKNSVFLQCDICARGFHDACRKPFEARSVLGNTSCHECLQESVVAEKNALPRPTVSTIAQAVALLKRAKKVLVVAGAGMSVSCGIPDFRSKDGIYEMARHMDVVLPEPECLFQIDYFRENPAPFFEMVQNVFAHVPQPSPTHRFLRALQDKRKLLRVYSQNVDGLEELAGVTRCVPCHGSLAWSSCMRCRARVATSSILPVIQAGVIPTCTALNCRGVLKPEITFFGELLSDSVSTSITRDRLEADLLLVIGTSLKVSPVAEIPSFVPRHIPQIVINKTPLKKKKLRTDVQEPEPFDLQLLGDCDTIVRLLCDTAKWSLGGGHELEDGQDAKRGSRLKKPKLIVHRDQKRICVDFCECVGVADGALAGYPEERDSATTSPSKRVANTNTKTKTKTKSKSNTTRATVVVKKSPTKGQKKEQVEDEQDEEEEEDDDDEEVFEEIVCDSCSVVVDTAEGRRPVVYRCIDCFDYDLCPNCYTDASERHFGGGHSFKKSS